MDYDFFGERDYEEHGFEEIEKEPRYEAEVAAYERAGPGGRLNLTLIQGGTMAELQKKTLKEVSTPEERFQILVDAISRKFTVDDIFTISQNDIDNMLDAIQKTPGIKYKNPICFILGYIVSQGGRSLEVKNVKNVLKHIDVPQISESGIHPADVVRYGRLWLNL